MHLDYFGPSASASLLGAHRSAVCVATRDGYPRALLRRRIARHHGSLGRLDAEVLRVHQQGPSGPEVHGPRPALLRGRWERRQAAHRAAPGAEAFVRHSSEIAGARAFEAACSRSFSSASLPRHRHEVRSSSRRASARVEAASGANCPWVAPHTFGLENSEPLLRRPAVPAPLLVP